jgi:hypothetical protein
MYALHTTHPRFLQRPSYSEKADVYSLVMVLWELTQGAVPYEDFTSGGSGARDLDKDELLAQAIVSGSFRPKISENTHPELAHIMTRGWHSDPNERPTAQEVYSLLCQLQETEEEDAEGLKLFRRMTADENYDGKRESRQKQRRPAR